MYDATLAETVTIRGDGGDEIEAYLARPMSAGPLGGVVVIHHMPGYDAATKEIARRFAAEGYNALMPEPVSPRRPGRQPRRCAAAARGPRAACPTSASSATSPGPRRHLAGPASSNGKVGTIGYCSGGRQAFLAGVSLPLDAAVDCYGAFVTGPAEGMPLKVGTHRAPDARTCPARCSACSAPRTSTPRPAGRRARRGTEGTGQDVRVPYLRGMRATPSSPVNRPAYRPEAAVDGWSKILTWFARYLAS